MAQYKLADYAVSIQATSCRPTTLMRCRRLSLRQEFHAGFTVKMPSNMEIVTNRLLEAQSYQLEPYRTDLLISAANAQIYNKNAERAIERLSKR